MRKIFMMIFLLCLPLSLTLLQAQVSYPPVNPSVLYSWGYRTIAQGGGGGSSPDSAFVSAIIDTVYSEKVIAETAVLDTVTSEVVTASAFYSTNPPNQILPLPVAPDTSRAEPDSLDVRILYTFGNNGLSREYLRVDGNGSAAVDTVTYGAFFTSILDHPDSAVVMAKCSDSTKVSLKIYIRHVDLAGTVTTIASTTVALRTIWDYVNIPLLAEFTKEEYSVEYEMTAADSDWIEVSRVKFIGRASQ